MGTLEGVATINVFLVEKSKRPFVQEIHKIQYPAGRPIKSWIYVPGLFRLYIKVEIEAIASVP